MVTSLNFLEKDLYGIHGTGLFKPGERTGKYQDSDNDFSLPPKHVMSNPAAVKPENKALWKGI
jgi:hypothetical protein